ncbi:glycoside hydrolase family 65 protein [Clostridium arbusti]|uniref:glycoside hydrolase family 65 protein n=1 Tax=Clostridium arbusti TaxID=1137848 RepID=UPI000287B592|nr:trehalase [Clostridium arbusti]
MNYGLGEREFKNWIVAEERFSTNHLGKCEAIMYLGNGYMGIRSATEETYIGETRNTFISGSFNKFDEHEVTELPNVADVTNLKIIIDGERFSLEFGEVQEYVRKLNIKTAELSRSFIWTSPKGKKIQFEFKRFVSLKNLHLISMKMEVTALSHDIEFKVNSGINGQMTNTGSQHFSEGERRIYDKQYVQLIQTTTQSKIHIVINTTHKVMIGDVEVNEPVMTMDRRKVGLTYNVQIQKGKTLAFEKLANIFTTIDKDVEGKSLDEIRKISLENIKEENCKGYVNVFKEHVNSWKEKVWEKYRIDIKSSEEFDLLAIRFALYNLTAMTPAHDSNMGIGAKGLSGEGYKGHSFWDTEAFILPFFIYCNPIVARSLLEYRYKGLAGARKKAKENGYEGAMYPWEAAWPNDGEVTPVWGGVDIVTGKQAKIWTGFLEQHITSDIAYAIWQYYMITGDEEFMNNCGYEILFDTAKFWVSRLEWNEEKQEYHINDVIGPDEYKEHVNNNAFTNYMAHHNITLAIEYCEKLRKEDKVLYSKLDKILELESSIELWKDKVEKIYLPTPNKDNVIPQDDTYLQKKIINLDKYKNQTKVGSLFEDFNSEQVNEMQISKQADIMMLFYLLENKFSNDVKVASYNYYEPKTLHDSSLSLSTHCILANDLGHKELAYELFNRAINIDLGPSMTTSDHGIHAASFGGAWQCVVMGFAGVRMLGGELRINPSLPEKWEDLSFNIYWKGQLLNIQVTCENVEVSTVGSEKVTLIICNKKYTFNKSIKVKL